MKRNLITLDYLEFFCEINRLVVGCRRGEEEVWISALGPHPASLTSDEVHRILQDSRLFELREMGEDGEDAGAPLFLTRREMERKISRMMN